MQHRYLEIDDVREKMSPKMVNLEPKDYPLDKTASPEPNRVYFIHYSASSSNMGHIYDMSRDASPRDYTGLMSEEYRDEVTRLAQHKVERKEAPAYGLKRKSWFSSTMQLKDASGTTAAEMTGSAMMGSWKIDFPKNSRHSSHDIDMRPVGSGRREEVFTRDSVPYFWDMQHEKHAILYVLHDGRRVQIGEFLGRKAWDKDCVLVIDTRGIDKVVAMMTCIAALNRMDNFDP